MKEYPAATLDFCSCINYHLRYCIEYSISIDLKHRIVLLIGNVLDKNINYFRIGSLFFRPMINNVIKEDFYGTGSRS